MRGQCTSGYLEETLVADEMRQAGFVIIAQNSRVGHLEADIIALDGDTLCVVEVKARASKANLKDLDVLIPPQKEQHLITIADTFARANKALNFRGVRFDFALVYAPDRGQPHVTYIKNAFIPGALKNF